MDKRNTDLFVENIYRLKHKLFRTEVYVILDYDTHVPDLMTRMRALVGFAVVGQTQKVDRLQGGGARIGLSIKYLPESSDLYANIDKMVGLIKNLPGVKTVKVITYNKKPILKNGKPLIY